MVRAIIEGRKIMTRRVIKPQPVAFGDEGRRTSYSWRGGIYALQFYSDRSDILDRCPYGQPGDRLWVRETWAHDHWNQGIWYKAGTPGVGNTWITGTQPEGEKVRPSIHMPRWASRLLLEVTAVRVERVQDISEEDAKAEGAEVEFEVDLATFLSTKTNFDSISTYRLGFKHLWNSINAKRGYGWDANCWVWAIEFKRIDQ
jgi:hypothetical protein